MQSIKIDNDIRSSLSLSPFGKYTSQLGCAAIYVCSYSLSGESVRVFITLAIDCIEIKVWNQRLFREATLAISFATVNALILRFISQYDSSHRIGIESMPSKQVHDDSTTNYTNANLLIECWDAIARSVSLNDFGNLTLNTQHIVYFTPVNSARGDLSYLLYSTSRYMEKEQQTWSIEFVSEVVYPFMLEVKVQKNPFDTKIYVTRIDQKYLRFLFLNCTLHTKIDLGNAETNKQIKPMFEYIVDELIYDTDSDTIIVRYIKKLELQLFNNNTISKNTIDSKFKMNEIEKSVRQTVIQTLTGNKTATLAFMNHNFSKDEAIEEEDETTVEEDNPQQPKKGIEFLKNKVKLVQIVGETRRALQTKDSESLDKGPLYFIVREALNIKGELRSKMSQNCIIQFLTQGTRMKDLLAQCSEYDLMRLSDACMLREINHTYELLGNTGDIISTIYIILHGQVDMIFKTHVQTRSDGHVLGNIMDGEHLWNADVVVRKSYSASLCCIPTNMILECVGIGGKAPREYMKCFWKSIRMWEEVMKPKIRPVFDPSLFVSASEDDKNASSVTDGIEKMLTISYPNTMNVTDSIRIRIVNAGNEIFRLGQTRHFLYLIVHGECAVLKKMNTIDSKGSNRISEIETGVRLLPGDFIFMDGESVDWIERKRKRLELELENPILRKNANKNTFDTHKHTMVAMTRVEICVVPITEISKSVVLFTSLLLLSSSKYSSLLSTQKDYERRLEDNNKWSLNRASVLEDVNTSRKQKALNSNPYTDLNIDTNAMSILEKILSELPSNNSNSNSNNIPKPPSNGIRSKSRSIKTKSTNYMNPNKNKNSKCSSINKC